MLWNWLHWFVRFLRRIFRRIFIPSDKNAATLCQGLRHVIASAEERCEVFFVRVHIRYNAWLKRVACTLTEFPKVFA